MRSRPLAAVVTAALALAAASSAGAQTIDTRSSHQTELFSNFGIQGQSFTVPIGSSVLDSYSFWVGATTTGASYTFETSIYAFGGSGPTGPALFTSDTRTSGGSITESVREDYVTGGLALTPGAVYIAMIRTIDRSEVHTGFTLAAPLTFGSTYAGGQVYAATGAWVADPTLGTYTTNLFGAGTDLKFVAQFSAATTVPEPATVLLVGGGLLALGAVRRRRRA